MFSIALRFAGAALGALVSFMCGAATSAIMINYAKRHALTSQFALPLLLEAALLLVFGLIGARLANFHGFFVSATVMLLCYIMGVQNAVITKISRSEIRTTHVTGLVTDIGIELGKLIYWNRLQKDASQHVAADRARLLVLTVLVMAFFLGGIFGAIGFQRMGYGATLPLALLLVLMAIVPAADDIRQLVARLTRQQ